ERGRAKRLEVLRPELLGATRRMKRVAQADEAPRAHLVRHHARNAAAQGLPADHEPRAAAQGLDGALPGLLEDRLTVGGASAPPGLAARPHVWKLEARDADSSRRELPGEVIQEGCVHRRARAVGEDDGGRSVLGAIEEEAGVG